MAGLGLETLCHSLSSAEQLTAAKGRIGSDDAAVTCACGIMHCLYLGLVSREWWLLPILISK